MNGPRVELLLICRLPQPLAVLHAQDFVARLANTKELCEPIGSMCYMLTFRNKIGAGCQEASGNAAVYSPE